MICLPAVNFSSPLSFTASNLVAPSGLLLPPTSSLDVAKGGVNLLDVWLEQLEAGLYLLEDRAGEHLVRGSTAGVSRDPSPSDRDLRDSFPTASNKPEKKKIQQFISEKLVIMTFISFYFMVLVYV